MRLIVLTVLALIGLAASCALSLIASVERHRDDVTPTMDMEDR